MSRIICAITLCLILYSCKKNEVPFVGTYFGGADGSFWIIELLKDSTFKYSTEGHSGNTTTVGIITFEGDTIYLQPRVGQAFKGRKGFLYYQNSCLIELDYWIKEEKKVSKDFCKGKQDNMMSSYWNLESITPISYDTK
ncbi:hypothetical protein GCM10011506_48140 [Marivirga lumbricoides]|uniref:DUF4369 domain-containing protein n=1 Tax=Marivirga lumbricoides TaxID=1046115 RepID=A0ABQ1NBQ5_9BACT|nr:hypothetical protein GCM10011506_48140 [Marivirga lumbricoides]